MLALVAAPERRRAAGRRLAELVERVDFDRLAATLFEERVLALAGKRLADAFGAAIPRSFTDRVGAAIVANREWARMIDAASLAVLPALESAGIPALPLKGPFLARSLYGDAGMRPSGDLDILVHPGDMRGAVEVIRGFGYDKPADPVLRSGLPRRLHFSLNHPGGLPTVEVHWRIHWYERDFSTGVLERSLPEAFTRRAIPRDELASLLLFYARDGFLGLRLVADIAAWWERHGDDVAGGYLDTLLDAHPRLRRALLASVDVAGRLVGLPRARLVSGMPATNARCSVAMRLSNWSRRGDPRQWDANVALIDGLLAPDGQLASYLRRTLSADGRQDPLNRLDTSLHAPRVLARFAVALWGVRAAREWAPLP